VSRLRFCDISEVQALGTDLGVGGFAVGGEFPSGVVAAAVDVGGVEPEDQREFRNGVPSAPATGMRASLARAALAVFSGPPKTGCVLVAAGAFELRDELFCISLIEDDARPSDEVDRQHRAFQNEVGDVCGVDVDVSELDEHLPCLRAVSGALLHVAH
jgi:hypothetical protein